MVSATSAVDGENDSETSGDPAASSLMLNEERNNPNKVLVVDPDYPVESSRTAFILDAEEYDSARDVLYSRVGEYGKWQRTVFIWASLVGIPAAWHMLAMTFFSPTVDHWCAKPEQMPFADWTDEEWKLYAIPVIDDDNQGKRHQCLMYDTDTLPDAFMLNTTQLDANYTSDLRAQGRDLKMVPCKAWNFDHSVFQYTISEQWNLVCDKASWTQFIQATYMAGVLVGCVVYGHLSNRIGRRSVVILGTVQLLISGVCCSLTENLYLFVLLRFLVAMGTNAQFTVAFILIMELIGGKKRMVLSVAYEYPFSFGFISLAGIAFFVTDWRFLQLAISVPVILFLVYIWVLPESPRWLVSEGRLAEAQNVIDEIADRNGRSLPEALRHERPDGTVTVCVCGLSSSSTTTPMMMTSSASAAAAYEYATTNQQPADHRHLHVVSNHNMLSDDDVSDARKKAEKELKYTLVDLFEKPGMRKKTINVYFSWFVNAFVYYGLSLNAGNLGGNVFVNVLLAGFVEIPAYVFSIYVLLHQGRRHPMCFSMVISGAACLATAVIPRGTYPYEWPIVALAMVGKLGISASFAIIYVYSGELYPTVVRKIGLDSSSMCAKVGSILAPFVKLVGDETNGGVPLLIFGAASLVAGMVALLLPETHRRKLPETLEEGEKFGLICDDADDDREEEKGKTGKRTNNGKLQQQSISEVVKNADAERDEDTRCGGVVVISSRRSSSSSAASSSTARSRRQQQIDSFSSSSNRRVEESAEL